MAESKQNTDLPAELQLKPAPFISVDLVRAVGIFLVLLLHISTEYVIPPPEVSAVAAWWTSDFFNSIARPCVPLFVMLSGYLLLQPTKVNEPLKVFFKKRWARIGMPLIFWGAIYFVWIILFDNAQFSWNFLVNGVLNGPYVTFWFLYMLIGIYLLTPILRVLVAYASDSTMKLLLVVWFVGSGLVPVAAIFGYNISSQVFILPGWIGYFLLGAYLMKMKTKPQRWKLLVLLAAGFAWTIFAEAFMMIIPGSSYLYLFYDYLTANVIVASVALFLLLTSISTESYGKLPSSIRKVVHAISVNSLPIYLFHMLLVEAFGKGLFGFNLTIMTLDPAIMTPLLTVIVLFLSLGAVVAMKKVPVLKRLIG
jgi:surface polysaccharide O-acyltransferase-like enzyme